MSQVTYVTSHLCHKSLMSQSVDDMSQNDFVTNRLEVLNKIVTNRPYNFGTHRFFFVTSSRSRPYLMRLVTNRQSLMSQVT